MPLVAVMALAVIAVIAILGIETGRTKDAATRLQYELERICRNTAQVAMVPEEAVRVFQAEINGLQKVTPVTAITRIELILPLPTSTELSSSDLYQFLNRSGATCNVSPYDPDSNSTRPVIPFAQIPGLTTGCSNAIASLSGVDCGLRFDTCVPGNPRVANPNYPKTMWSTLTDSANTVACEFDAEVDTVLPRLTTQTKTIKVKSAWWVPLRTRQPYLEAPASVDINSFAGLAIAVAPQLSTWASGDGLDGRFEFHDSTGCLYGGACGIVDPTRTFISTTPTRFDNAAGNPLRPFPSSILRVNTLPTLPVASFEQREMLLACMNPLVLARNLIVSSLLELASRHGQTRNLTEFSVINSRHETWNTPNRPVNIVEYGQDLTAEKYQHPYVTHETKIDGPQTPSGAAPFVGPGTGFTLPWENFDIDGNNSTDDTKKVRYNALVSSQLRICYHLYNSVVISRPPLPLHNLGLNLLPPRYERVPEFRDANPNATDWDYAKPWGSTAGSSPGTRLLTAPEVAFSMGSVQRCPMRISNSSLLNQYPICNKVNFTPADDLMPDIVAYLKYKANITNDQLVAGHWAYPSPGLFPPRSSSGSSISSGQPDVHLPMMVTQTSPKFPRSAIIIVVHKSLPDASIGPMSQYVNTLNRKGQPVIVILIPGSAEDSNGYKNYCKGLNKWENSTDSCTGLNSNLLFFLSPWNSEYGSTYTSSSTSEEQILRSYWQDILFDNPSSTDPYYYDIARTIFSAVLRHEPKL